MYSWPWSVFVVCFAVVVSVIKFIGWDVELVVSFVVDNVVTIAVVVPGDYLKFKVISSYKEKLFSAVFFLETINFVDWIIYHIIYFENYPLVKYLGCMAVDEILFNLKG